MATKAEMYRQMANHATATLTFEVKDWIKFLIMAGKLYKYDFQEILMIYTQRPGATACAEFDFWTERMGRRIRRGSHGVALPVCQRDGKPALRYVFDVADTVRLEHSRDPMIWQYRDEYRGAVTARFAECFKVPGTGGLDKQLVALAALFANEHWAMLSAPALIAYFGRWSSPSRSTSAARPLAPCLRCVRPWRRNPGTRAGRMRRQHEAANSGSHPSPVHKGSGFRP